MTFHDTTKRMTAKEYAEFAGRVLPNTADVSKPPFALPANTADEFVIISLSGDPQGKGRARAFRRGNFIGHYTPEKTRSYEGMIRTAAMDVMGSRAPIDCPIEVTLSAIFAIPASFSRKKRDMALSGALRPAKKPDADNIIKAWTDAMNGVVYRDDCLIVKGSFAKTYGVSPMVCVTVRPCE